MEEIKKGDWVRFWTWEECQEANGLLDPRPSLPFGEKGKVVRKYYLRKGDPKSLTFDISFKKKIHIGIGILTLTKVLTPDDPLLDARINYWNEYFGG